MGDSFLSTFYTVCTCTIKQRVFVSVEFGSELCKYCMLSLDPDPNYFTSDPQRCCCNLSTVVVVAVLGWVWGGGEEPAGRLPGGDWQQASKQQVQTGRHASHQGVLPGIVTDKYNSRI